jgi:protein-disulfide isomerase
VVNGREITEAELLEKVRGELLKVEVQLYEVKRQGLEELISQSLIEQAAKARNLSPEQLLQQEVSAKVAEVTPKEVEDFYNTNRARLRKPLEEMREQILPYLQQTRLNETKQAYIKSLRGQAQVNVYVKPPVVEVSAAEAPLKGPQDAPITIVEFSDFQCPFCKRVLPILTQVLEQYAGKVRLAFRDFPLASIHPFAQKAAEAAHCAADQGKYWEYHDLLFEKQESLPTANFIEYAQSLGLTPEPFKACLESGRYAQKVERNQADGLKAGISGTPAFFINGRPLSGAQPLEAFKAVIDEELGRLGL